MADQPITKDRKNYLILSLMWTIQSKWQLCSVN